MQRKTQICESCVQIISITNFSGEERKRVKQMISAIGAKYTGYMTRTNSVLICKRWVCLKLEWQVFVTPTMTGTNCSHLQKVGLSKGRLVSICNTNYDLHQLCSHLQKVGLSKVRLASICNTRYDPHQLCSHLWKVGLSKVRMESICNTKYDPHQLFSCAKGGSV